MNFDEFVTESWKIEGLSLTPIETMDMAEYHHSWVEHSVISIATLSDAAAVFTKNYGRLRNKPGMDVRVGSYYPPKGGYQVEGQLRDLCESVTDPFTRHIQFETIHPFMDGNGRVGRLLWLRDMIAANRSWQLGFLHTFYYQALGSKR